MVSWSRTQFRFGEVETLYHPLFFKYWTEPGAQRFTRYLLRLIPGQDKDKTEDRSVKVFISRAGPNSFRNSFRQIITVVRMCGHMTGDLVRMRQREASINRKGNY